MFKDIKKSSLSLVLVSSLAFFTGCGIDNDGENIVGSNLVSAEVIDDINASTMLQIIQARIKPEAQVAFGYKAVKINYDTLDINGDSVEASGLLVIPVATQAYQQYRASLGQAPFSVSMICDNHGTIFTDAEAPSNVEKHDGLPNYTPAVLMTGLAGFAAVLPDYVGYGTSNSSKHPYLVKEATAQASLDMIRASVRYMTDTNVVFNSQLYISGYSQGGHAALALAEEIELNNNDEFTLMGVAPMAGPYVVDAFGDAVLEANATMSVPAFMAYISDSFSGSYTDVSLEGMIVESKVPAFENLFDGSNDIVAIQTKLGLPMNAPSEMLFDSAFITDYVNTPTHPLRERFRENNVGGYASQTKINLIHCSNDDVVPVLMTHGVEKSLNAYGSTSVSKTIIDDVTADYAKGESVHSNCGVPAYGASINWFAAIRNGDI